MSVVKICFLLLCTLPLRTLSGQPPAQTDAALELYRLGQATYYEDNNTPKARQQLEEALGRLDPGTQTPEVLATLHTLTIIYYWSFASDDAMERAARGYQLAIEHHDAAYTTEFLLWMGRIMDARSYYEDAIGYFEAARDTARVHRDTTRLYQSYDALASALHKDGQTERGLATLELVQPYIRSDQERAGVLLWRGVMLGALGRLSESRTALEAARDLFDQTDVISSRRHVRFELSNNHLQNREYEPAIALARAALDLDPARLGPFDYRYGYDLLARTYRAQNRYDSAYHYLNEFLRWERRIDSLDNQRVLQDLTKRYELREQQTIIEQQQTVISRRWWLGLALALAVVSLALAMLGVGYLYRTRRQLGEQKQTIEAQTEKLRELDRLKSNFFTNISHELRTPLTLIQGPIQTALRSGQLDPRHEKMLGRAGQSARDLHELIESILALSKLEARELRPDPRPVRLYELVHRVAHQFESHAALRDIRYTFQYLPGRECAVEIDDRKLTVILNNLIGNALKYSNTGDAVRFEIDESPGHLHFTVSDTGRGISEEDQRRIFDRYYQAAGSKQGGAGIGLAMVREFTELMGGTVAVESSMGTGTTFRVQLPKVAVLNPPPMEAAPEEVLPISPAVPQATSVGKSRLLIVDDNEGIREFLAALLGPYYQIDLQINGAAAQKHLRTCSPDALPDLILSDVMMPEMDGFQLLDWLKSDATYAGIPVMLLTARAGTDDKLRALRVGVDDYLLKPFLEEELLARIANLLNNYRVRRETRAALEEAPEHIEPDLFAEDHAWLQELEATVERHYANPNYSVGQLAADLHLTERTLRRRIKQLVGLTPTQYLKTVRLDRARQLLEARTYRTVARVVTAVGLRDGGAFTKNFRERYGKSPVEYL